MLLISCESSRGWERGVIAVIPQEEQFKLSLIVA